MRLRRAFNLALVIALFVGLAWPAFMALDVASETLTLIPADEASDTTPHPFVSYILAAAVALPIEGAPVWHPLVPPLPRPRHSGFLETARAPPGA